MALDQVARSSKLSEPEKISQLSKGFEAILVRNILENAQKPLFDKKGSGNTASGGIYRDLLSNQTADMISQSGTIGLARQLERELSTHSHGTSKTTAPKSHS